MGAAKYSIEGSDYVGVFATATDKYVLIGNVLKERSKKYSFETLKVPVIGVTATGTSLIGLFMRANSNGIIVSNLAEDYEIAALKELGLGVNIATLDSNLNAIGNNILANDKIAIINPDYGREHVKLIQDVLGVEVIKEEIGGFKTVGANNILTNKGFVTNNNTADQEKEKIDKILGFDSIRTTANTGSLNIGLSTISNSNGVIVGENTTGYELARIMEALELND